MCGVRPRFLRVPLLLGALFLLASAGVPAEPSMRPHGLLPAPVGSGGGSETAAAGLLYVCNQDDASVAVIDLETGDVVRTVDLQALGFSANARPHHIAIEPDGSYWYVSLIGEGVVAKLDGNDRLVATASFETPGMLALDAARGRLYVARSMTAVNPPRRIGEIRTSDMTIDEVEIFFPRPHALVLDPRTGTAYTASLGVNQVAAVDAETGRAFLTDVEGPPHALMQFALSPDGRMLAISGEISHTMHFFDLGENPLEPRHAGFLGVGIQPFDPIFDADGRTVWFGNKVDNTIMAVDVATREIVTVLDDERIREPHGAARSLDGRFILISNSNVREGHTLMLARDPDHAHHQAAPAERVVGGRGSVAIIDAATHALVRVIEVGQNATGIAVGPR
jgi:DNA-binding beta-propeller fold protein YncE